MRAGSSATPSTPTGRGGRTSSRRPPARWRVRAWLRRSWLRRSWLRRSWLRRSWPRRSWRSPVRRRMPVPEPLALPGRPTSLAPPEYGLLQPPPEHDVDHDHRQGDDREGPPVCTVWTMPSPSALTSVIDLKNSMLLPTWTSGPFGPAVGMPMNAPCRRCAWVGVNVEVLAAGYG